MPERNWKIFLKKAPTVTYTVNLVRCIPKRVFSTGNPQSFLFTSGRSNRCNPKGIQCLYMAADRNAALTEYDKYNPQLQPIILFYGKLRAQKIINLSDSTTWDYFGFTEKDFFDGYRLRSQPTPLQRLGFEISQQSNVAGIRFPSFACKKVNAVGHNYALYRKSFSLPDTLEILNGKNGILEKWP